MPVSHIGLTVSHLPTSCSFFLSALQSLGYRFIGQQGNQIGLGIHDADFFLCQETPGVKASAAHIAFTAPSRTAVRDFYAAALNAGGRPNGAPASRTEESDHFNAAVLDVDGNSIEVVYQGGEPDFQDDGTVVEHSRVITWQRSVTESCRDDRSIISSRTAQSASNRALVPAAAPSKAPSIVSAASTLSKAASMVRSVSAPVSVPRVTVEHTSTTKIIATGDGAAKKIIGTLLGAAAGAAVAYAMVKGEEDSAKKEAEFDAYQRAKAASVQAPSQPQLSMQDPQLIYETTPRSVHRNISDTDSHYSTPQSRSVYVQRAIEPAPRSYHSPSYASVPPTQVSERRAIEYIPAASVAPSRSQFAAHRSYTDPELLTVARARSLASKAQSVAPSAVHSTAPSTLISSFVPDQIPRRSSEGSVHSHHSSRSKAKSHVSKHSSTSKHSSKSRSRASSPPAQSKAGSIVGSILGRDNGSTASSRRKEKDDSFEIEELDFNDTDTVAPSDSISNAGSSSRRSHRSHRSSRHDSGSVVSKHSSTSKHSKSSKHSHRSSSKKSHHSRHGEHEGSPLSQEYRDTDDYPSPIFPTVLSEPSDASTVKPYKPKSSRKDSVAGGQYDALFNGPSQRASTVASLPIRGITPSMVEESRVGNKGNRSVITYTMGQKLRPFEE
ncbi:hypothetical protein K491DRAFT_776610 [Lophiostoma macrostomum CBS 122681]|uniref:VOC domain-containing protein n=1 Tax=Lophiostoma macrostomum CBS 122681 TaxID=1314788 RepID=A0A6A6TFL0_9PLEO|nr:hypothetical protein K491DRAFT_776610 [Lophiostoma macrostomum CBS 122681]